MEYVTFLEILRSEGVVTGILLIVVIENFHFCLFAYAPMVLQFVR